MFELNFYNLKTTTAKRIFFGVSLLLLFFEIAMLYVLNKYDLKFLTEPFSTIFKEVLINLVGSTITAVVILMILIFLVPIERNVGIIQSLDSAATKTMHKKTLETAKFWYHNGHFGRWVRTTAMPHLAKKSKEDEMDTEIQMIILDPSNIGVCNLYMHYRKQISYVDNRIKNVRDVQAELLATILKSHQYNQNEDDGLKVKIYLNNHFNIIREDINDSVAFRTQVNPRNPAIVYFNKRDENEVSHYYNIAVKNFHFTSQFCNCLIDDKEFPNDITVATVRSYLTAINMLIYDEDEFIEDVIERTKSKDNGYN